MLENYNDKELTTTYNDFFYVLWVFEKQKSNTYNVITGAEIKFQIDGLEIQLYLKIQKKKLSSPTIGR